MDAIFGQLFEMVVKPTCSFAKKHISYVVCGNKLIKELAAEFKNLEDKKTEIHMRVNGARGNGEDIVPQVDKWLEQAGTCIEEVDQLLGREKNNLNIKCGFNQCFSSSCRHYKTGKETVAMLNTLKEKLQEARETCFTEVGISPPPPPPADMVLDPTAYFKGYDSREFLLEEIIEALKVNATVGIYGMAGVGKTMLVNRLVAEVKSQNLFDEVGIAVVSRTPDLAVIRNVIADRVLHTALHANSDEGKKDKFHKELVTLIHQRKKVLLVLDDVWELLDLHQVGLPCPSKSFKVVVTSRFRHVGAQMGAKESFEVRVLERKEAWSLFRRSLGDYSEKLDSAEGFNELAEEMVEHFGGLPHALVTLARGLIGEELSAWRDAAYYLRERSLDKIDGMSNKVMGAIVVSFNYLRDKEAQFIFLLCCLFPEDWNIEVEVLMKYGIGLGLFGNVTLVWAMNRVERLTEMLMSRSLLLEGSEVRTVKMHSVIRDTGLHIASKGEFDFHVKDYRGSRIDAPSDGILIEKHAISISSESGIMEIFSQDRVIKYYKLQILRLHGICVSSGEDFLPHKFSTYFFVGMRNLKVLEIRNMEISNFPTSLGSLKRNLRTMCLHHCLVGDFKEVGQLTNLEILDLRCSRIHGGLYGAVQRLIQLRVLDLTFCHVNELFDHLVGGLPRIEGLYMLHMANMDYIKPNITNLGELEMLTRLEVLELQVGNPEQLSTNFLSILGNISSFSICISKQLMIPSFYTSLMSKSAKKILSFEYVTMNKHLHRLLGKLLKVADAFQLHYCDGLPNMFRHGDDVSNLRYLCLSSCDDVEFVVSGPKMKEDVRDDQLIPFAKLEGLTLSGLSRLKAICAPSHHVYPSKLKCLYIELCDMLPYAFPNSVARQLRQLENLEITNCGEMEEIFAIDNNNNTCGDTSSFEVMDEANSIVLPSLQLIKLFGLPKLKFFSTKNKIHGVGSAFFGEQVQLQKLKELHMHFLPSCGKIWEIHHPQGFFGQLRRLSIWYCMQLRYIFPAAVARGLVQLKKLEICMCGKLEEVVMIENGNDEETIIKFPRLHFIFLEDLQSLHSFYSARSLTMEFPSLEAVEMSRNDNMQRFSYGSLHTPKLSGQDSLNTIVARMYEETKREMASKIFESCNMPASLLVSDQEVFYFRSSCTSRNSLVVDH